MESNQAEIQQLRSRLDVLIHKQNKLHANVDELRNEIAELQTKINNLVEPLPPTESILRSADSEIPTEVVPVPAPDPIEEKISPVLEPVSQTEAKLEKKPLTRVQPAIPVDKTPKEKSSIESFLGENLANKIGIAIILIGIGVGVKYAIDKNILGPAMRIALGYLAGAILIGFAVYLKKKYENLSAVMFAGGMAVAYFVTFIAHDFYQLFPKLVAFGSMVVFTIITSLAAIRYDKQVIAIVGLVGAYAVPFLLSDGSGTTFSLFIYMTIINAGILFLAFRKNWEPVFSVAFGCTWFIFFLLCMRAVWELPSDYETLLPFSGVFYVQFYAMLIANKMRCNEQIDGGGTTIIILNSIFGYTFGVFLTNAIYDDSIINGVFTLLFAASQGIVTFISSRQKEADHRLYYLSFGFALIYATISVPMMFDGNWITIMWSMQAALFFWIGWKKDDGFFEKITYIPLFLAFISMFSSWFEMSSAINMYAAAEYISPVINEYFAASLVLSGSLFFMTFIKVQSEKKSILTNYGGFFAFLSSTLVYLGIITLYASIVKEIDIYWAQQSAASAFKTEFFADFFSSTDKLKTIWILIFSLIYAGSLQLINRYVLKDKTASIVFGGTSALIILLFLTLGLYDMSLLRDRALADIYGQKVADYPLTFSIRYIGYAALAFAIWGNWKSIRNFLPQRFIKHLLEIIIHVCLVWVVCSELIHLKRMNGGGDFYRAGLTVFGGIYSFGLIAFGIWKNKPHLRLLALILFGITLLKLFVYDIAKVDSGGKTIAFISLGVLLLVISFLYTKYKHLILPSNDDKTSIEE